MTGTVLAGPLAGRIFDLAGNRASLLMGRIMHKHYHFFYSTQERPGRRLQLSVDLPPDIRGIIIPVRPKWFNILQQGQIRNFVLGIEFLPDVGEKQRKELLTAVNLYRKS
ncbi:MAG: hypothetical protein ACL93V_13745 [Candidatus Electrothrix sp. YB6]